MADIVIRGMEMPKNEPLTITITQEGKVFRAFTPESYGEAVPLPEGHGRLIDADKLTPDMVDYICGGYGTVGSMCTLRGYSQQKIDNAPTILEAEVKKDG